ncbi:MAG: hypothetical protein E4H14_01960 [Candidatus Thorarchaeota archaeon]|nr:MAG: hypothetical protein E4H14_01960 [Candidatus Thorarchaeota archaeon]
MSQKQKGMFQFILAVDAENSGIAYKQDDPSYDVQNDVAYQAVAMGLVVANARTLMPVEELYLEIQWDGVSGWQVAAEKIHGLSKAHLDKNGVSSEEAVVQIGELILKYWGPNGPVGLLGHNVTAFDLPFLRRLLRSQELEINFGYRHVDTHSVGFAMLDTYNSDNLFEMVGLPPRGETKHNALSDAKAALEVCRRVRALYNHFTQE